MQRSSRNLRRAGFGLVAAVVVFAAVGTPAAESAPVKLLQTVDVEVAADGSIPSIRVEDLSSVDGGDAKSERRDLNPADAAPYLPVEMRTSYLIDGKAGTDLSDLKGQSGDITVEVAVTNTTGRMQPVTVSDALAGGKDVTRQVLVTTPLTVILTAELPDDLSAFIDRRSERTNGAVAIRKGKTIVQWGAVLAPPALEGTATFSLHLQGAELEVDKLSMTIERGVQSDFSVDRIAGSVFGQPAQQDSATAYATSSAVYRELDQVANDLVAINAALAKDAVQGGVKIVNLLEDAKRKLQAQADDLLGQVRQLSTYSRDVKSTSGSASNTLDTFERDAEGNVDELTGTAGTSLDEAQRELVTTIEDFRTKVKQIKADIDAVQAALAGHSKTPGATASLIDLLRTTIGVPAGLTSPLPADWRSQVTCPAAPQTDGLLCTIAGMQELVTEVGTTITDATKADGTIDLAVQDGKGKLTEAQAAVESVSALLGEIGSVDEADVQGQIAAIRDAIEAARTGSKADAAASVAAAQQDLDDLVAMLGAAHNAVANADAANEATRTALVGSGELFDRLGKVDAGDGIDSVRELLDAASADAATVRQALLDRITTLAGRVCDVAQIPADVLDALLADAGAGAAVADEAQARAAIRDALESQIKVYLDNEDCAGSVAPADVADLVEAAALTDLSATSAAVDELVGRRPTLIADLDATHAALATAMGASGLGGALALANDLRGNLDAAALALDGGADGLEQRLLDVVGRIDTQLVPLVDDQRTSLENEVAQRIGAADDGLDALQVALVADLDELQTTLDQLIAARQAALDDDTVDLMTEADARIEQLRRRLADAVSPVSKLDDDMTALTKQNGAALEQAKARLDHDLTNLLDGVRSQLADTKAQLKELADGAEAEATRVVNAADEGLDETERQIEEQTDQVFTSLTGSKDPDPKANRLASDGYQGLLSTNLGNIETKLDELNGAKAITSDFRGVRHAAYLGRLFRAEQQRLGALAASPDEQEPFDGDVEADSTVATVWIVTFSGVK
ncbi:MAG: hypothetical protein KDB04_18750 [Acidimicrobiales bacterium]|nr:hypothetical protein [Acidimicrobiales bacterium]HRW39052.1 hypothetical protein [Aquihabitans sp.]